MKNFETTYQGLLTEMLLIDQRNGVTIFSGAPVVHENYTQRYHFLESELAKIGMLRYYYLNAHLYGKVSL